MSYGTSIANTYRQSASTPGGSKGEACRPAACSHKFVLINLKTARRSASMPLLPRADEVIE